MIDYHTLAGVIVWVCIGVMFYVWYNRTRSNSDDEGDWF